MENKRQLNKIRRKNAQLYPIYKMFSWDLLFFYSIEFLFCTITKKVTASELLIINGFYLLFRILMQIPAVAITDFLGKRKSIILGNMLLIVYMLILLCLPGAISIIIADLVFALGYDIKTIAESNLLYDSVSTRGGEGLYSKLDAKGGSWYYILDGIASLVAGYLFVINNYIPMLICLGFIIISTILSFGFKDIYEVKKDHKLNMGLSNILKEYGNDLKSSFKFILKSKRMKSFILFQIVFYSVIEIIDTYNGDLLINIGIPEEQFSMIFAVLTLIGGISLSLKRPIERKFKNRTLAFISLMYIGACIVIGTVATLFEGEMIIPVILIMYAVQKISTSIWYILEAKYLKNFTKEEMRNKLTFTYEFIGGIAASIFSMLGGLLLDIINVQNAFLIVGLLALASMVITLDYMRTRFGLRPEEYKKEDIEFESSFNK
ncbi:MAG: MFS transporter [Clostridia bacterium]|nr:MFS transporter [Clostridia bacterium]